MKRMLKNAAIGSVAGFICGFLAAFAFPDGWGEMNSFILPRDE